MCNVIVQRTRGTIVFIYLFSSPVVLNNKTRYARYRICGQMAMEQAADLRESSWGRYTWQVRLMMASFGAWELESNGVSRNKRERRVVH